MIRLLNLLKAIAFGLLSFLLLILWLDGSQFIAWYTSIPVMIWFIPGFIFWAASVIAMIYYIFRTVIPKRK